MQRFDEKLRELRQQRGLTMRELAERLGLAAHGYIGDLESGWRQPPVDLLVKIADFFGVSLDQLAHDNVELE
ncbi:MAG: helix-turn-helix transcriptional regulator [Chloroflexales bacterium]|nr:helix-turn-helix transcriptional regulator [Chloroflexales bacterium]